MFAMVSQVSLVLAAAALAGLPAVARARKFLQFEPVGREDVDGSLAAELAGNVSREHLAGIERGLRAVYTALPKSAEGGLEHQAVRYVLHRYFVQQHGWYVRGLEPGGDTFGALAPAAPRKDWIAPYVQERFEERSGGRGVDLRDLAALAAALEDVVHKEASLELQEVYKVLDFPLSGRISSSEAQEVLHTYMMIYLTNRNVSISSYLEATKKLNRFQKKYSGWAEAEAFLQGVAERHEADLTRSEGVDFTTTAAVVAEIGERFGAFNDGECEDLKKTLIGMEPNGGKLGRIRLHDFYNKSLYTHWKFTEKVEYLRELGALDESNASQPLVIVPNYMSAFSNCLKATSIYAVCCRNECEDLLGHLEKQIAGPTAPPDLIVELVSSLPSDTVPAPRKLPGKLLNRLYQLAAANGGEVPLHGRLFAQWLHHAFPRECPYPHEAGTTNPQTAAEWMNRTGHATVHASKEEMQKVIDSACAASGPGSAEDAADEAGGAEEPELPWSDAEELLGGPRPRPALRGWRVACGAVLLIAALGWLVAGRLVMARGQRKKLRMVLAFTGLLMILCALDLLDVAFFLPLAAGLVLLGAARHALRPEPALARAEKCCV